MPFDLEDRRKLETMRILAGRVGWAEAYLQAKGWWHYESTDYDGDDDVFVESLILQDFADLAQVKKF